MAFEYEYQFPVIKSQFLEHHARLKEYSVKEEENKKALLAWQDDVNELNQQHVAGLILNYSYRWENKQNERSELFLRQTQLRVGKEKQFYILEVAAKKFFGFFTDMRNDYSSNHLLIDKYIEYLTAYKKIMNDCSKELSAYQIPIIEKIKQQASIFSVQ